MHGLCRLGHAQDGWVRVQAPLVRSRAGPARAAELVSEPAAVATLWERAAQLAAERGSFSLVTLDVAVDLGTIGGQLDLDSGAGWRAKL